jgi:hypothetical protein
LRHNVDTETSDWFNHRTVPSMSYGCPLTNLDNEIAA